MRRGLVTAAVALAGVFGLPLSSAAAATPLTDHSVTVAVDDVTPNTPVPSTKPHPMQFVVTVVNNTQVELEDVTISADRGAPIATESELDNQIAKPTLGDPTFVSPVRRNPLALSDPLPAGSARTVTYRTTTGTNTDAGICLCAGTGDSIYPIYFSVSATDPGTGGSVVVGTTQTYLPAFVTDAHPAPLDITWVWPLLDRPHRLSNQKQFLDDDLAGEVSSGGRLDRALTVVEQVAPTVPLTLLVDPDLLDELEVMAAGPYQIRSALSPSGFVAGTGTTVARAWLDRFTSVINAYPDLDVELTAFADPDVESLTRNGLPWTPAAGDPDSQNRLAAALGKRAAQHNVAWPYGSTLSQATLTELVRQGTTTVVVDDTTLPRNRGDLTANALAKVTTSAGPALAAVTSKQLETDVGAVLKPTGSGLSALPQLVSHLAIRVLTSLKASHYVVLTPPRMLDVDPEVAVRAILATAHRFWARPLVLTAAPQIALSDRGILHDNPAIPGLPGAAIDALKAINTTLPGLTGKYGLPDRSSTSATTSSTVVTIDKIPVGAQRAASSELVSNPTLSTQGATKLAGIVDRIRKAVHLVAPAGNASYTLTANDAPLPVTVTNPLDVDAQVRIQLSSADNILGFSTQSVDVKVPAGSTQQFRVPTRIEAPGRINVLVTLSTPHGMSIGGAPLVVSVRNTALGTVGVAITTIAAIVLGIALLVRGIRAVRWRMRRRNAGPPGTQPPVTDPLAP